MLKEEKEKKVALLVDRWSFADLGLSIFVGT